MKSSEIKQIARNKLSGNWSKAFGISAIYMMINIALSYCLKLVQNLTTKTPILFTASQIIFALILLPLSFGLISSITKLIHKKQVTYTTPINDALLNFSKSIEIFFITILKMIIPALLLIIATIGIIFLTTKFLPLNFNTLGGYILLISFLVFIDSIIIALLAIPYVLASYALANENDLTSKECINTSISLMENNKWNFIKLIVSFLGWFLLTAIIIGLTKKFATSIIGDLVQYIGTILIFPYIIASIATFYDEVSSVTVETINNNTITK